MTTATHTQPTIPLAAIVTSKTNPRKTFDKGKLEELTESIRLQGVLQPILVRPLNGEGTFEVVAGERRFKAATAAGLADIPATVRELTDAQALELQVIENNQREDLHPLEEAEGYEALLKCNHPDGSRYRVEDIAAKVGKSKAYVYQKLKLCSLCPEARKTFYDGKIDFSRGLLIARIPDHNLQRQALKEITQPRYDGEPINFREAQRHVQQTYMLSLEKAPFDIKDANLVPKAGACGPCPKRTGNQSDLFGDVKSADVCTDPKCFDAKRQAHYAVAVKALEAKGKKVVSGDAAKKLFPNWDSQNNWSRDQLSGGYLRLTDTTYASGRSCKVSEVLGKDYEPTLIQHPGTGEIVKVATQQAVAAASQDKKRGSKPSSPSHKSSTKAQAAPTRDKEEVFRERLFRAVAAKLPAQLGKEELRAIAEDLVHDVEETEVLAEVFFPTKDSQKRDYAAATAAVENGIEKADAATLARLVVGLVIGRELGVSYGKAERLLAAAKRYRVDPEKIKKAIADEEKAAKKAAPPPAATAKPAPKKKAKKK